jgi:hypothetical protein
MAQPLEADFGGDSGGERFQEAQEAFEAEQNQTQQAPAPAPGATTDPKPQQQQGKIQDDPVFQSLPRNIQKQVEGGMPLDQAVQLAAKAGGGAGAPAPQAAPNAADQGNQGTPTPGGLPAPVANPQAQPNVAQEFGKGVDRLTAGQVLEGGRSGRDTFARPGSQGFRAFSGQEFNPFLLRPEAAGVAGGAALSARDALQTGDVGRQVISSGGQGGFSLGGQDDPFLKDIIGG